MLTPAAKQAAGQQIQALIKLGTPQTEAVAMIARGAAGLIRKSLPPGQVDDRPLPTVDTSEADKRREELAREQDKQPTVSQGQKNLIGKLKKKIMLKLKPRKGDPRPFSPTKLNGEQWLYQAAANGKLTVRQLNKYKTPVFVETVVNDAKTGDKKMEKSNRFDKLVEVARGNPSKLTQSTRDAVNRYLSRTGQTPVITPAPKITFGRQITLSETAQLREHQRDVAIAAAQTPVAGPSLRESRMTPHEIQAHRLQQAQQLEQQRAEEAAQPATGLTASWL